MTDLMKRFVREEQGQDLVEYTLLLAFVCLAAAALFIPTQVNTSAIWSVANAETSEAASAGSEVGVSMEREWGGPPSPRRVF